MNVKHYELVEEAKKFLKENFDLELSIPIEYNTRLKKTFGCFRFNRKEGKCIPTKLEMSVDFMRVHPKEHIIDVLRHELVHYALCAQGLPERHFDDGHPVFENKLKELNVKPTNSYYVGGEVHQYKCSECGSIFRRKIRLNKFARCTCSLNSKLEYEGTVELNHEGKVANNGIKEN